MWNERKFCSLPLPQQHKKAAELLRILYEQLLQGTCQSVAPYTQLANWMGYAPLLLEAEALADRYHEHLRLASQSVREHRLLPHIRHQDRDHGAEFLPITIYLDQLRSAHNVGSICRTTEAFRLGRLALSVQTPGPECKQVKDASMGSWEWVAWERVIDVEELPRPLIALETSQDAISLAQFQFPERFTLVLGNEERGCSAPILAAADALVEIPLVGRKNSLNVANTFAIAAATIRQRMPN